MCHHHTIGPKFESQILQIQNPSQHLPRLKILTFGLVGRLSLGCLDFGFWIFERGGFWIFCTGFGCSNRPGPADFQVRPSCKDYTRTRTHTHTVLFSQALLHAGCWVGANLKWVLIETNSTTHGSKLHEECSWVVLSISKASCLCPSDE